MIRVNEKCVCASRSNVASRWIAPFAVSNRDPTGGSQIIDIPFKRGHAVACVILTNMGNFQAMC
jgi:hypothetical protein